MEVYILMLFFLILFEFLTINSNTKTKYRLLLATTIILILVQGLRSFSIGVDLKTYQIIFDRNSAMSFSEIFAYYDAEWGYHLLNKIIFVFGGNLRTLLFIVSISIYIPLYLVVKKYSKMPFISYLLFMFLGLFTFSLSGLRQTMAMGITILAFMQIKDKNLIKFIILVTFAMLFHKSALIFYFAYPLYHFRISRKRLYLLIIPMIIIFIFRENIITFLTAIYDSNYQIVDTGAYNFLLLLIFLLIGSVLLLVKKYGLQKQGLVNLLIFMVVLQFFASYSSIVMRLNYYFFIYLTILIPDLVDSIKGKDFQFAFNSILLLFLGYMFFMGLKDSVLDIYPYRFFINSINIPIIYY